MFGELFLSLLQELGVTTGDKAELAQNKLAGITKNPGDAELVNNMISARVPSYQAPSPEEQVRRADFVKEAKKTILNSMVYHSEDRGVKFRSRSSKTLFLPGKENFEKNRKMAEILENGTPEQKHDLFLEICDRMSSVDVFDIYRYSDKQLIEHFNELFPILHMGTEAENFLKEFTGQPSLITEKERADFNSLKNHLCDGMDYFSRRINNILNPLYPEVDVTALKVRDSVLWNQCQDRGFDLENNSSAVVYVCANLEAWMDGFSARNRRLLSKASQGRDMTFSTSPDMEEDPELSRALIDGEVIYGKGTEPGAELKAFRLFKGALLKEVPIPVEEPGPVAKFFDGFFRLLGFNGLSSCRDFEHYQEEMRNIESTAENEAPEPEYKNARQNFSDAKKQRDQYKETLRNIIASNNTSLKKFENEKEETLQPVQKLQRAAFTSVITLHQAELDGIDLPSEEKEACMLNIFSFRVLKDKEATQQQIDGLKEQIKKAQEFTELKGKTAGELSQLLVNPGGYRDRESKLIRELTKQRNTAEEEKTVEAPETEIQIRLPGQS